MLKLKKCSHGSFPSRFSCPVILLLICAALSLSQVFLFSEFIQNFTQDSDKTRNSVKATESNTRSSCSSSPLRDGVLPIYKELYETAKLNSQRQLIENPELVRSRDSTTGVIIGPVEGNFQRHILRAFRNARRIRVILGPNDTSGVKVGIMIAKENVQEIQSICSNDNANYTEKYSPGFEEGCRLWNNGTLFDDVVVAQEEYQWNDQGTNLNQGSSKYWLKALGGYKQAPYGRTMFLDSDAYPCPGFEYLFNLLTIQSGKDRGAKRWVVDRWEDVGFASGLEQWPFGAACAVPVGDDVVTQEFSLFPLRNTGVTLFNFREDSALLFSHFIPLVSEYIYNNVTKDPDVVIANDQCPFRVAMFTFELLHGKDFSHRSLPLHSSCRSYPGLQYAGLDGFLNGMFPVVHQYPNGTQLFCKQCICTPCLVAHTPTHPVTLDGQNMGWE